MKVNYDEILVDDEMVEIMMRHLDIDGDGGINIHEFKSGVEKLLASSNLQKRPDDKTKVRNILMIKVTLLRSFNSNR